MKGFFLSKAVLQLCVISAVGIDTLLLRSFCAAFTAHAAVSPEWDWAAASPESQGMITSQLESIWTDLKGRRTTAFLVIRNDQIVFERFATGHNGTTKHYTASMAKALVGGISLAVALSDGRIALDDQASKYVARWADDPVKSKITIRQLGSHTSGLADAEENGLAHEKLTGWKGDFWKRLAPPNDPFTISRDKTPLLFTPGGGFQYSNPGMAMLGYAVTAALNNSAQRDLRSLLRERVLGPIGVPDAQWSVGYEQTFNVDGLTLIATWGGGSFTPRATARVGRLMLRKGNWEGQQLIASSAVEQTTMDAGTPANGAVGWWSNNDASSERLPKDAFWGAGAGHQVLLVVPSLRLIAVRNGESLSSATNFDAALREYFFHPLMNAVNHSVARIARPARYPPSPVIKGITWSPKHAGKCYRSSISYNAGLRRYLWCQTLPGGDARFRGGFGIYDAPEPWGPWTTVSYTEAWDVGPGESSSFPTKWMSLDGQTLHLVFSGDDCFSVRIATFVLHGSATPDKLPLDKDEIGMTKSERSPKP